MARKLLCCWRVSKAEPSGLQVWFDPELEEVRIYELEPRSENGVGEDLEEGDQRSLFGDSTQVNEAPGDDQELPF